MNMKQIVTQHRPARHVGRGDKYLPAMAQELRRYIAKVQRGFPHDTFCLTSSLLGELAAVLVEFGEDIHNGVGIWEALETYNEEFFGVRLPCMLAGVEPERQVGLSAARVQHLLWVLWPHFKPELIARPDHRDLAALAEEIAGRLATLFDGVPRDSGVRNFLGGSNRYGWVIKRKLLWLGRHSYLFRLFFEDYMSEQANEEGISETDDFVCQECTPWSGLGVVDILARVLDLDEKDRGTLRDWYKRHAAPFLVLSLNERDGEVRTMQVKNLVSEQAYAVRLNLSGCPFETGNVVFGSLVPWRGEWYWSGQQRNCGKIGDDAIRRLVADMVEKSSAIVYRYRPDLAERAAKSAQAQHEEFLCHCGDDLKHFPDGHANS